MDTVLDMDMILDMILDMVLDLDHGYDYGYGYGCGYYAGYGLWIRLQEMHLHRRLQSAPNRKRQHQQKQKQQPRVAAFELNGIYALDITHVHVYA